MRLRGLLSSFFLLSAAATLLSGCSTSFAPSPSSTEQTSLGQIGGIVHGGQQPVVGAHIYAYAAGTSAYGTAGSPVASTSLIGAASVPGYPSVQDGNGNYYVATASDGSFEISAATTCTVGTVVYLYSIGGDPGDTGYSNPYAGLMTALGVCGDGLLADSVTTRVFMNEVSTVAAAYALAGFAVDATDISAPSATDSLAATGIQNAIQNAGLLFSFAPGAGGSNQGANTTTPNGNGMVPQPQIDTIANILAACVNDAPPYNHCSSLFGDILSNGTSGTAPADTATAAIYIAQNPTANVGELFDLPPSTTSPFTSTLTTAPNDFTVGIIYTGGGLVKPVDVTPRTLSVDAAGNVWNADYGTKSTFNLAEFSPQGVPLSGATGYTGNGLDAPFSSAVDTSGDVWVTNYLGDSLSVFGPSGSVVANYAVIDPSTSLTALDAPSDAEFDGSGNVFISNVKGNNIVKASSLGVYNSATASGLEKLNNTYSVALEPGSAGSVWGANQSGRYASYVTNDLAGILYTELPATTDIQFGSAVDGSGNVWMTVNPSKATNEGFLAMITTAGTLTSYTPGAAQFYSEQLVSDAVDGAGNVWATDGTSGTIYEVSNAGVTLSGTYGFIAAGNSGYSATGATITIQPNSIALDGSGDVWYTTDSDATLRELVGAAVPVATPISYAVKNSMLGARP